MQNGELQNATSKSIVVKDATDKTIRIEDLGTSEDDSTSICTTYEYDVRDNLTKATEKEGNYKIYSYDVRDRVTSISRREARQRKRSARNSPMMMRITSHP